MIDLSGVHDQWLFAQLVEGRETSALWAEFVRRFYPPCYRVIRRVLLQRLGRGSVDDLADDLFQSFFSSLLEGDRRLLKRYRGDGGCSPRTYLCYLAGYHVLSALRARKGLPEQFLWSHLSLEEPGMSLAEPGAPDPSELAESRELLSHTMEVLSHLSPSDQRLFQLLYVESLPLPEVATRLSMTATALRVAHHRLRKRIRSHLEKRGHQLDPPDEEESQTL